MTEPIPEENVFSTRDLALAATLMTLKFRLEGTDMQYEGSKREPIGYFKFTDSNTLKEARQKYMQSMLQVEPQLFVTNMRALKAEVQNWAKNPHQKTF
jgi:hypothetical protein